MKTENLIIFGIFFICIKFSCGENLLTLDELRLNFASEPTEEINRKIETIFENLTTDASQIGDNLIKALKLQVIADKSDNNEDKIENAVDLALKAYGRLLSEDKDVALSYHRKNLRIPQKYCPSAPKMYCNPSNPYRNLDGSCFNLANPWWGMYETPYKRLLPPQYDDGYSHPRTKSITGKKLPNPRHLALTLHSPRESDSKWSLLFVFFSQFVAHDISFIYQPLQSNGGLKHCPCNVKGKYKDRECFNIPIPKYDEFNNYDDKCMDFPRSFPTINKYSCNLGPREQFNRWTHWLDLSQTYGSNDYDGVKLRKFVGGLLKSSQSKYSEYENMPISGRCPSQIRTNKCYLKGEGRGEDSAMILSMHTLWLREHNRIARLLAELNPNWEDETLYQEARRIVIAEYQHIIYSELLPVIIGYNEMKKNDLIPLAKTYLNAYDERIFPQVINEFIVGVFRSFHTLIRDDQLKANKKHKLYGREDIDYYQFNSSLYTGPEFENVLYGIINQPSYEPSPKINPSLNNRLFEGVFSWAETKKWSLPAMNIQRGRDHGIPGYNFYRELCGLKRARSFSELYPIPEKVANEMSTIYAHPDDIDLFTGIVSEVPVGSLAAVGPTGACIYAKQFRDLKFSDRFFYENGDDKNTRFTLPQLNSIRKTSMARILCDNTEITTIQDLPFLTPKYASRVKCKSVPKVDLSPWIDYGGNAY